MSEERCETCKFWRKKKADNKHADDAQGACRRFPPALNHVAIFYGVARDAGAEEPVIQAIEEGHDACLWPFAQTVAADWCGEYRPIGAKPDVERIEEACSNVAYSVDQLHGLADSRSR